jgi:hypothetical protein
VAEETPFGLSGAQAVVALVMLEWAAGTLGAAVWTQSWSVVTRGHFRILAWCALVVTGLALLSVRSAAPGFPIAGAGLALGCAVYLAVQYSRTEIPALVAGAAAAAAGALALVTLAAEIDGWSQALGSLALVAGAVLLGGVTNGMLLGHWYLNQPGLKPWALARLTHLTLAAIVASFVIGAVAAPKLSTAVATGGLLGMAGFGESFGVAFYVIWISLVVFTGAVAWMARRCVMIRSIQSATGLYYVALLTAGVSEFLVRYLMVNSG